MSLYNKYFTMLFATLLVTFALHVHAEELQGNPISVRGLVVSSRHALTINDGVRDYILLGVNNPDFEGKICEAFGVIGASDGMPTIEVRTITIIADEYPDDDLVGTKRGFGSPFLKTHQSVAGLAVLKFQDVTVFGQCNQSLPIREGSGMRLSGVEPDVSQTACRFQYTSTVRNV